MMSDEQEASDKNFRSAYYKSLGFRGGEKSITQLETLLKAEIFDVKRLKLFCLKHTLTVYYRPLVWKIILSVIPVVTDRDTTSFVKDQKRIEFHDLKHALHVMGRLERTVAGLPEDAHRGTLMMTSKESSSSSQSSPPCGPKHSQQQPSLDPASHSTLNSSSSSQNQDNCDSRLPSQASSSVVFETVSMQTECHSDHHSDHHKALVQESTCTPRDFVTIFLLESNCLLSTSVNQLNQEEQVNRLAIAEAFLTLFEEESQDSIYWLFSNFVKKLESQLNLKEELLYSFIEILEDVDCVLLEHLKDLDALENALPVQRWFGQCFARDLPESCIESVWDRVIGGSSMVLVYVAVTILLSLRKKILGLNNTEQMEHLLNTIPKDNFTSIVSRAIELWEAHNSPLLPSNIIAEPSPSLQELHYGIEDYS